MHLSRWVFRWKPFSSLSTTVRLNLYLDFRLKVITMGQEKAFEVTGGKIRYAFTFIPL